MNWANKILEPENEELPIQQMIFTRIERISLPDEKSEMSLIGQFFVAPRVLIDPRSPVQVPIYQTGDREILLNEIAPHFTKCRIVHFQGDRTIGILEGVKPSSIELFLRLRQEGGLHPIVKDLFRDENALRSDPMHSATLYEINTEMLGMSEPPGFSEMWSFIGNTFLRSEPHFTVVPQGWDFGEHLTKSLYLRALNTVCKHIHLYVDSETNHVTAISGMMH